MPYWTPTRKGFLRSEGALIQTMGRAATPYRTGMLSCMPIVFTGSMQRAIDEVETAADVYRNYTMPSTISPRRALKKPSRISPSVSGWEVAAEPKMEYTAIPRTREGIMRLIKRNWKNRWKDLARKHGIRKSRITARPHCLNYGENLL